VLPITITVGLIRLKRKITEASALLSFQCHVLICKWHARWRAIYLGWVTFIHRRSTM
jgi:hypothetical protein